MAKYHINPETGAPLVCSAKTPESCKYSTSKNLAEHFNSKEEARKAYEKENNEQLLKVEKISQNAKEVSNILKEMEEAYYCEDEDPEIIEFLSEFINNSNEEAIIKVFDLIKDKNFSDYRSIILKSPQISGKTLDNLVNNDSLNMNELNLIAYSSNILPKTLTKLSNNNEYLVRMAVAINTKNVEDLNKLSDDPNSTVRGHIAINKNITKDLINKLSNDSDPWVKGALARNPITDENTLIKISKDKNGNKYFIHSVLSNKKMPGYRLSDFVESDNTEILAVIAGHENTTSEDLLKLSKNKNKHIQENIASNKNTPLAVLIYLSKGPRKNIRDKAKRTIGKLKINKKDLF